MSEIALSGLRPGEGGRVLSIGGEPKVRQRLQEMGLVRGTEVKFVRSAPLGDPIEVRVRGYSLTLRRTEADGILLERAE